MEVDLTGRAPAELPRELARLHRDLHVDAVIELGLPTLRGPWTETDALDGAGFAALGSSRAGGRLRVRRLRSLPDTVGPGLHVLVCGLNPSLHAADAGVGYVTGSNRFWPAAQEAGLVTADRDPWHALDVDGVGMTDLVKRATRRADELDRAEFRDGVGRLDRLCALLEPAAVAVVGLSGWRAGVDRRATPGWQARAIGGRPVYLLPSTSGLNAATSRDDLVEHLRAVARGHSPEAPTD